MNIFLTKIMINDERKPFLSQSITHILSAQSNNLYNNTTISSVIVLQLYFHFEANTCKVDRISCSVLLLFIFVKVKQSAQHFIHHMRSIKADLSKRKCLLMSYYNEHEYLLSNLIMLKSNLKSYRKFCYALKHYQILFSQ